MHDTFFFFFADDLLHPTNVYAGFRRIVTLGLSVFSPCVCLKTEAGEEERLIAAVHCFPCLWQVSCINYKNAQAREHAWEQVAKQVR